MIIKIEEKLRIPRNPSNTLTRYWNQRNLTANPSDFRLSMKDHVETKTFANLPSLSVKVILSK